MSKPSRLDGQLRIATSNDVASLSALSLKVWLATYAKRGITDEIAQYVLNKFSLNAMAAMVSDTEIFVPVVEIDGHLVAYAQLKLNAMCSSDERFTAELSTPYVQEPNFGEGLGSKLLDTCLETLSLSGKPSEMWLRVNSKSTRAIEFYTRHGFEHLSSVWIDFDGERNENFLFVLRAR
jgi:diamine N-acetyltransferase